MLRKSIWLLLLIPFIVNSCKKEAPKDVPFETTIGGPSQDGGMHVIKDGEDILVLGYSRSYGMGGADIFLIKMDRYGKEIWRQYYGEPGDDIGIKIVSVSDGYLIAANTNSSGAGAFDYCLIKVNKEGNMQWNKTYGGAADENLGAMLVKDNNIYLCGTTESFGAGGKDVFLIKTDLSGNQILSKTYGDRGDDGGTDLQTYGDSLYVFGYTYNGAFGDRDFYLVKCNIDLDSSLTASFGTANYEESGSLLIDADGNLIMAGHTNSTDPDHTAYVVKCDRNGTLISDEFYGGIGHDGADAIVADTYGNYLITGYTTGMGDGEQATAIQISSSGTMMRYAGYGGAGDQRGRSILDDGKFFWICGSTSANSGDIYIAKVPGN